MDSFRIDGKEIIHLVLYEEYNVSREDLDGPNAGRTLDGKMHRDYLGPKRKVELYLKPLTPGEWGDLEHGSLRNRPWHSITFDDFGRTATMRAYHSSFNGTLNHITGRRHGARLAFIEE